jgi:hypothetical protein
LELNLASIVDRLLRAGEGKVLAKLRSIVTQVNALEESFIALSDEDLLHETASLRERYIAGETLDDLLPEAFASVREASRRTLGMRPFDVQIMGGAALHLGNIAEMKTGEGKTLVATLPAYLNAIAGRGVQWWQCAGIGALAASQTGNSHSFDLRQSGANDGSLSRYREIPDPHDASAYALLGRYRQWARGRIDAEWAA